jgi:hypothetical protein
MEISGPNMDEGFGKFWILHNEKIRGIFKVTFDQEAWMRRGFTLKMEAVQSSETLLPVKVHGVTVQKTV